MRHVLLVLFFSLAMQPAALRGQTGNWQDVGPELTFIGSKLNSITNIGDSILIALGDYIYIEDSSLANGVAVYKNGQWSGWPLLGQNYHPLSSVCFEPSDVTSFGDKIVFVSTDYVQDTANIPPPWGPFYQIRTWNGNDFDTLGRTNTLRTSIKVINGELYAYGRFGKINEQPCRALAKYNGQSWECLDPPFGYKSRNIGDIYIYDNKLWVGGNFDDDEDAPFSEIAYLDLADSTWNHLDSGIKQDPYSGVGAFMEYKGELYIGGSFRYDYGNAGHHIMRWDGEKFKDVGGGVFGQYYAYSTWAGAPQLQVFNDELWVGGSYYWVGGIKNRNLAVWDGEQWCTTGDSLGSSVWDIEVFQGELYILVRSINGDTITGDVAKWTGGNYRDTCGTWPLAVEETTSSERSSINIYPNPAKDYITIKANAANNERTVQLWDGMGRMLRSFPMSESNQRVDLAGLPGGLYVLRIRGTGEWEVLKFIKQ